jgi:hypothetical protein
MPINRRTFLTKLGQGAAMASVGGLFWGYLLQQKVAQLRVRFDWRVKITRPKAD